MINNRTHPEGNWEPSVKTLPAPTFGQIQFIKYINIFLRTFIDYSMAITYLSLLCVYVVFIGSSIKEVRHFFFIILQNNIILDIYFYIIVKENARWILFYIY